MREYFADIDGNPFLSYKAFTYAASTPGDERLSEEGKRVLQTPRTHPDAISSPEHVEWEAAITDAANGKGWRGVACISSKLVYAQSRLLMTGQYTELIEVQTLELLSGKRT